jgi:zinc transport system permease protein
MSLFSMLGEDFVLRALAAGIGVAIAAGPLGCLVVWRRMAYFGDAMAHSALLGIALGLGLGLDLIGSVAFVGVVLAAFLALLMRQKLVAPDTLLGLFSHTALASGLIVLSLLDGVRIDLHGWLFGDILAVNSTDLWSIWGGCIAVLALLLILWRVLLAATVNRDLARTEGMPVALAEALFMLMMALTVAAAIKVVGVVLTTALLIMPAAAARQISRSPESMALIAALVGACSVIAGLMASLRWDSPAGPSIVVACASCFTLAVGLRVVRNAH